MWEFVMKELWNFWMKVDLTKEYMEQQYMTILLDAYRRGYEKRFKDSTNAPERKEHYFKVKEDLPRVQVVLGFHPGKLFYPSVTLFSYFTEEKLTHAAVYPLDNFIRR